MCRKDHKHNKQSAASCVMQTGSTRLKSCCTPPTLCMHEAFEHKLLQPEHTVATSSRQPGSCHCSAIYHEILHVISFSDVLQVWVLDTLPGAVRSGGPNRQDHPADLIACLQRVPLPLPTRGALVEHLVSRGFSEGVARWASTNLRSVNGAIG